MTAGVLHHATCLDRRPQARRIQTGLIGRIQLDLPAARGAERCHTLRNGSAPNAVAKVDDTASEAVLLQELELQVDIIRQRTLAATDDDRAEEQVALVD